MQPSSLILPWYPWPGRGWPALPDQEQTFVADLEHAVSILDDPLPHPLEVPRNVYTAVLNALRGGAALIDIRNLAPGLSPTEMLAAYNLLAERVSESRGAVDRLLELNDDQKASSNPEGLREEVKALLLDATRLLPTPCERLISVAVSGSDAALVRMLSDMSKEVRRADDSVHSLEEKLANLGDVEPRDSEAMSLGRQLYDPYGSSALGNPFYAATRVANVDAMRAKLLLFDVEVDPEPEDDTD